MYSDQLDILIRQKMKDLGFDQFRIDPFMVVVDKDSKTLKLGNSYLFLCNKNLDIPITALLELQSEENIYVTSKADFENQNSYRYQCFSQWLKITIENYGITYIPFQLEFIKVTPIKA
ncbi:MAG: hypothetical protein C0594_05120 [Marinilabiliales bacterium]|nr:MAG: hypothetical protein C0594_05120 [Marinilabiliales bacterium]